MEGVQRSRFTFISKSREERLFDDTDEEDREEEDLMAAKMRREQRRDKVEDALRRHRKEMEERKTTLNNLIAACQRRAFMEMSDEQRQEEGVTCPEDIESFDAGADSERIRVLQLSIWRNVPRPESCAWCVRHADEDYYLCDTCRCGCYEDCERWSCPFCLA